VLDVGAAYGHIATALAAKVKIVTAIEPRADAVPRARLERPRENVTYVVGDFLVHRFDERFDVVVAANVLEHIRERPAFLAKCAALADRLLVRVPAINRDWLVPYRRELGLEWRLHPDHEIEYTEATLRAELQQAGWRVTRCFTTYGAVHAAAAREASS
ncbi:MAG: class I SAM-dependent methyltransferase, partial [Elusimicrobia bacterium]|nr:class I SAM-dependent methyltransferase [Elusimicrobiota bacterium]